VSGRLAVIGIGPGDARWLTPEAEHALAAADALYGYGPYLDRVPARPGQARHASGNREEGARAAAALRHAAAPASAGGAAGGAQMGAPRGAPRGCNVALVCGGDPGVFAMAAAVCAEIEAGPQAWRRLDVTIVPGITAMLAVAARAGAPLGHDFCALSLSDNLKPWDVIERRLHAAAAAGFAIALYNPVSRARPWQLGAAFDRLARHLPASCPVVFGRAVGRADEAVRATTLAEANKVAAEVGADMATLVIIGTADTRMVAREGLPPLVYTPRSQR
jgi:precorrin-3B C17-methyltransferase